jgi:hypothetical protein
MKYFVAASGFVLVSFTVAVVCEVLLEILFPSEYDIPSVDWKYIPATILGILAGIHSWRASIRMACKSEANKSKRQNCRGE